MRPKKAERPIARYRYETLVDCEEAGNHRVVPTTWPPPRTATMTTDPYLNMQCELCGAWLIVYEGHATGQLKDIDVILPEKLKKQPA